MPDPSHNYSQSKGREPMEIKQLPRSDLKNALDLVWSVFQEFEAPDYVDQGVTEFRNFIDLDSMYNRMDNNEIKFWGCYDNESPVGVIALLGNNHISLLFVRKEYHRQGIARQLFEAIKNECKSNDNIKAITVNSSPYAASAYRRLGFVDTSDEKCVNGIRFIPMKYQIT